MIGPVEIQPAGTDLVAQVAAIFSPTGILSRAKNFEFRPQQQEMAVAVAKALQNREHLAVEAGTGVGKSLAYLVPAILFAVQRSKKAVISTHTINLQEQLTQKDLPMLAAVLGSLAYRFIISLGMRLGLAPTDLKMATGLMVILALGLPALKAGREGKTHLRGV